MCVRIDGEELDLDSKIDLDKNKKHNIAVIIDRLILKEDMRSRVYSSIESALKLSNGKVVIDVIGGSEMIMSENYACPHCDFSLPELEPRLLL